MIRPLCAWLYRGYLRILAAPMPRAAVAPPTPLRDPDFQPLDNDATRRGEVYRGVFILLGVLGIVIVFLALAPVALGWQETLLKASKWSKFVLMLLALALVGGCRWRKSKSKWIDSRLAAEQLRYRRLELAIQSAKDAPADKAAGTRLLTECHDVLTGPGGQIAYNERQMHRYERIEHRVSQLTFAGFAVSILAAGWALLPGAPSSEQLLLGTAFVPAAMGTLHAVNGFLRLPQLAAHHKQMFEALAALRSRLTARGTGIAEHLELLAEANQLVLVLRRGDQVWDQVVKTYEEVPH
jgi:hypothetical protein